ncbi:hypothetical protein [Sphingobium sp. LSP13-1-1.1]|uniref:hypothetical protein n=1 Tax=Sphingobium sp. LSP13-1-1.1 TaxID=3135234 RepID=UPI0034484A69
MIVVSVILLSAQDGSSQELARMEICNMGTGTATMGNYSAETLRGRSTEDFARRTRQRIAYVSNHPRKREHVWNLVAKCLRNLRYGGDWSVVDHIEISGVSDISIIEAAHQAEIPADVRELVIAGRNHLYGGGDEGGLDKALEAFASRICWDDDGGTIPEAHANPCTCGLEGEVRS